MNEGVFVLGGGAQDRWSWGRVFLLVGPVTGAFGAPAAILVAQGGAQRSDEPVGGLPPTGEFQRPAQGPQRRRDTYPANPRPLRHGRLPQQQTQRQP